MEDREREEEVVEEGERGLQRLRFFEGSVTVVERNQLGPCPTQMRAKSLELERTEKLFEVVVRAAFPARNYQSERERGKFGCVRLLQETPLKVDSCLNCCSL